MSKHWGPTRGSMHHADMRAQLVLTDLNPTDAQRTILAAEDVARLWRMYHEPGGVKHLEALFAALDALSAACPEPRRSS